MRIKKILLINPPIYDFSAYSLWAKPVGLLKIASALKSLGVEFYFLDTLDISVLTKDERNKYKIFVKGDGTHNYIKEKALLYQPLVNIKREFYRFGLQELDIRLKLRDFKGVEYVLITSIMSYWYFGVSEVIKIVREELPCSKIVLGGIYVNLCMEHASKLGADYLISSIEDLLAILSLKTIKFTDFPLPLDLYRENFFAPIYTSFGCPFSCIYCANKFLNRDFKIRGITKVFSEILHYIDKFGVTNFAFYDDALLIDKENNFIPLMEHIIKENLSVKFYSPNGVHISQIDEKLSELMFAVGFKDIRLSLETANPLLQRRLGYKTNSDQFVKAFNNLKGVGFRGENLSVYLLVGLPYQTIDAITESINFVKNFDIKIKLAEYSPIPHTLLWNEALKSARYDIKDEPFFQNSKLLPVAHPELTLDELNKIKGYIKR